MTDPGYSGDMNYGGGYGYQPPADPKLKQRGTVALGLSIWWPALRYLGNHWPNHGHHGPE